MTTPTISTLNLDDVQGDILGGLPKKTEVYYFFQITDVALFKAQLPKLIPLIKSTAEVLEDRKKIEEHKKKHAGHGHKPHLIPMAGANISFSMFGLKKLGITDVDKLGNSDPPFARGQLKDSLDLGDRGEGEGESFVPAWNEPFKQQIDAVFDVAGDSHGTVEKKLDEILHVLGVGTKASIQKVTSVWGNVRPGDVSAHEHFGFLDGISNPKITGFDDDNVPGPHPVPVGSILLGREGDGRASQRPSWALDGSFLVFRHLFQLVPEFNEFLRENPIEKPGLTPEEGSELLGARLVGRWKSGTPIDLAPERDDPEIAKDPARINNFRFDSEPGVPRDLRCPFAAHVRKTNPRRDLEDLFGADVLNSRKIMRRGIQFGPEETGQEKHDHQTYHSRGLLFACYQSSIETAFKFIQQSWANTPSFPPPFRGETRPAQPGLDIIIGQAGGGGERQLSGTDPNDLGDSLTVPHEFVIPRGGEYFFVPSIKALKETFTV